MKSILHVAFAIFTCATTFAAELETAAARANRIEIPRVDFRETTLPETCEFLTQKSRQLDSKRVNIIIAAEAPGKITLNLEKRPLLVVLREAAAQVGCEVQEEPYALVIRTIGAPKLPAVLVPKDPKLDAIRKKLDKIVIPVVELRECKIGDAVEFLVDKSAQLDPKNGVNVVLMLGNQAGVLAVGAPPAPAEVPGLPAANAAAVPAERGVRRITLRCDDMPLLEILRYAAGLSGLEVEVEMFSVLIRPPVAELKAR